MSVYVAIDLDAKGSGVWATGSGKLLYWSALQLPQPRGRPDDGVFRQKRYLALKDWLQVGQERFGVPAIVFGEETDWLLPLTGRMRLSEMRSVNWKNQTVARALGRLEGYLVAACCELNLAYQPVPVKQAKYAVTEIGGKKTVTKAAVQEIVTACYPELRSIASRELYVSVCDAVAVLWAGLKTVNPLFHLLR